MSLEWNRTCTRPTAGMFDLLLHAGGFGPARTVRPHRSVAREQISWCASNTRRATRSRQSPAQKTSFKERLSRPVDANQVKQTNAHSARLPTTRAFLALSPGHLIALPLHAPQPEVSWLPDRYPGVEPQHRLIPAAYPLQESNMSPSDATTEHVLTRTPRNDRAGPRKTDQLCLVFSKSIQALTP